MVGLTYLAFRQAWANNGRFSIRLPSAADRSLSRMPGQLVLMKSDCRDYKRSEAALGMRALT